jgi:hypothetical protein
MELSFGILAVSVAVAATVLFAALPRIGTPGAMTLFLRYAAVSGVAAVGSSAMYYIYGAGGGIVSLVLGDVAMVFAPALLLVALKVLEGERARRWSIAGLGLALVTAIATSTLPQPPSLAVKAILLTVVCLTCVIVAARSRVEPWGPMRLIIIANGLYAVYSAARVVVGVTAGWGSALYRIGFSFAPTTVVSGVVIVLIGVAVVRLRLGPRILASRPVMCPPGRAVVVGDWALASAAYGQERMRALVAELQSAARTLDDTARDVPRGVEIAVPDAITKLGECLRDRHGWSPDEVTLLVDGATTAAIPIQPARSKRRSKPRSART